MSSETQGDQERRAAELAANDPEFAAARPDTAVAAAIEAAGLVSAGDRVPVLGFTSVDYTTIDVALGVVGAVSVPLQTSAAIAQLKPIVLETEPPLFAASVDYLSDAVAVILA